jgi:hypothetical protein
MDIPSSSIAAPIGLLRPGFYKQTDRADHQKERADREGEGRPENPEEERNVDRREAIPQE